MTAFSKLSRTDVSALASVVLFSMTILISAVGPVQAQGSFAFDKEQSSPAVGQTPNQAQPGYRA